jgi:hypothetical protein
MLATWVSTVNLLFAVASISLIAKNLATETVFFENAPDWLTEQQVEKAARPIESYLQWDKLRLKAVYYRNQNEFESLHHQGPSVKAFFRRSDRTVHIGPGVTAENFIPIFSHEWVHAIFFLKYHGAIPLWLEEGFANYLAKLGFVDYRWLSTQPFVDVQKLVHPMQDVSGLKFHYQTATALVEMIASKCSLPDLLQLSVKRKLENYLKTYCEIADVNASYRQWVAEKAKAVSK